MMQLKQEIKKQEAGFVGAMMVPMAALLITLIASPLIKLVASSLINTILRFLSISITNPGLMVVFQEIIYLE